MIICQVCGRQNPDDATHCEGCEKRLRDASRSPSAQRRVELRQATVLFCDLVGSTRLPSELDAAALVELYDTYYDFVTQAAHRQNGHVNRIQGDGAMLLFGYPDTREDAAECALGTALELSAQLAERVRHPARALSLRVGVATGTVVFAGEIDRATNRELSLLGPVPERAARLQSLAEPGQVLVDATTRRLAGDFFEYRELGPRTLKNVEEPVTVWQALAATRLSSRFAAQRRLPGRMIGREPLLAQLQEEWQAACAGSGRAAVLVGEAGIGKSVLAQQMQAIAAAQGARVATLDCSARMTNSPLHPVAQWLRSMVGLTDDDDTAALAAKSHAAIGAIVGDARADELMRYLSLVFSPAPAPGGESADRTRGRLIEGLAEVVVAMAARQPLCMVLEDAQWADATTLNWLERVVGTCAGVPLLLLVTTRPDADLGAGLVAARTVRLERLDPSAARELVEQSLADADPRLLDSIVARGDGVPLYLEELARDATGGSTARQVHTAAPAGMVESSVPWVMQVVVQGRLDRWNGPKPVVHAAAVLGREFTLPLLARVLDQPETALAEALAQLAEIGILAETPPGPGASLRFGHALIHEAVYDAMIRSQRVPLHARAAAILLEQESAGGLIAAGVLIHHLAAAERFAEAVGRCIGAAFSTAGRASYVESRGLAEAGLAWVDRIAEPEWRRLARLQLLTLLGTAAAATDGYAAPAVEQAFQQARVLCEAGGDPATLFPVVRGLGFYYFVRAQMSTAEQLACQCMAIARNAGRPDFRVEALSFRGYTDIYVGRIGRGRRCLQLAVQRQRLQPDLPSTYPAGQHPVTAALVLEGNVAWAQGDVPQAQAAPGEALAFARSLGRPFDEAYVLGWAAGLRNLQRRWDDAQRLARECIAVSERYGFEIWHKTAHAQACWAAASQSPSLQAVQALHQALQQFTRTGAEVNSGYFMWGLARGLHLLGDKATARGLVRHALESAMRTDGVYIHGELLLLDAELEDDPQATTALVVHALRSGLNGGGPTLALRAALRLMQLHDLEPTAVVGAEVPAALDGQAEYPARPDWIRQSLDEALGALRNARPALAGTWPEGAAHAA